MDDVRAYVGLMLVIFSPEDDLTNSLLMNKPIGCLYSRPLGASRLTKRSDIVELFEVQVSRAVMKKSGSFGRERQLVEKVGAGRTSPTEGFEDR